MNKLTKKIYVWFLFSKYYYPLYRAWHKMKRNKAEVLFNLIWVAFFIFCLVSGLYLTAYFAAGYLSSLFIRPSFLIKTVEFWMNKKSLTLSYVGLQLTGLFYVFTWPAFTIIELVKRIKK